MTDGTMMSTAAGRGLLPRLGALLVGAAVAAACGGESAVPTGPRDAAPAPTSGADGGASAPSGDAETASGKVTASLVSGTWQDGTQEVTLQLEGAEGPVGAYQGRLVFADASIQLAAATGAETGFHAINDTRAEDGRLRFAGFHATGFAKPDVLTLTFRTPRPLEPGDLDLSLEVVGDVQGLQVPDRQIAIRSLPGAREVR